MKLDRTLTFATLAAACLLASPAAQAGRARITPAWSLTGTYPVVVPVGFASLAGEFTFPLGGGTASARVSYDEKAQPGVFGVVDTPTVSINFGFNGSFRIDPVTGRQHVHFFQGTVKNPQFSFQGLLAEDGGDIVGTYDHVDGFANISGAGSDVPLTMTRSGGAKGDTNFLLSLRTVMDERGTIRGLESDGVTVHLASLTLYGGSVLTGGKVKGKLKTARDGTTSASVKITARGWRAKLSGPVDADGFHALCDVKGGGFTVNDAPVLLAVQPGPPGPPPPVFDPFKKIRLTGATARVVGGNVTITHTSVPLKFFGKRAGLTITFPSSDGIAVVHADPASASIQNPRRCIVTIGGTTYGTATAPADVTLDIRNLNTLPGGSIRVLATGKVATASGKTKTVNMFVEAVVQ